MNMSTGKPENSWEPVMTGDTTISSYWINWRVFLCAGFVLTSMIFSSIIIWKNEGTRKLKTERGESVQETTGLLYEDEVWKPCLKHIHPAWLLAFRIVAFFVLLVLLIVIVIVEGNGILYYYTQWTFILITIYFGLGSLLSMNGCYQNHKTTGGDRVENVELDAEQGNYAAPPRADNSNACNAAKSLDPREAHHVRQTAGLWGYVFQIIFQMSAGAVMLTDFVFWFLIVPFLAIKNYNLTFLTVNMHTINVVFLLGDTALNSLRFPWFRMAYFFLWTAVYVVFQWIVHACVSVWWPYPFLDLSSSYSPLWYSTVAVMHIPCYALFALIIKMKHHYWSKWFPQSFKCAK